MCHKYFDGKLEKKAPCESVDKELAAFCAETAEKYHGMMEDLHLADAIDAVMGLARRANQVYRRDCAVGAGKKGR